MRKLKSILKRVRLVYRPAAKRTKLILLGGIVLSLAALLTLNLTIGAIRQNGEDARAEAGRLEQENDKLGDKIDGIGSIDGALDYAEDELGMVPPDATVVVPVE